jgi:hypothetical protein
MALLTKCVYGLETNPKKTPFGFINNQVRNDNIIQNAGWFNIKGERLGEGDLSLKDMHSIAKHIPSSEAFFALTEVDSGWNLPSHLDRTAPGLTYIMQKAVWVIARTTAGGVVVRVRDDIDKPEDATRDGEKYVRVPRTELYKAFGIDKSGAPLPRPEPIPTKEEKLDASIKDKVDAAIKKATMAKAATTGIAAKPSAQKHATKPSPLKPPTVPASPSMGGPPTTAPKKISIVKQYIPPPKGFAPIKKSTKDSGSNP